MASRDAHWLPHVVADNHSVAAPAATPRPAVAAPKPAPESKFLTGPVINGKPTAKQMRDGLRLCEGFNKGACSNKNCGNGAHRCSVILRAEQVCGSPVLTRQSSVRPRLSLEEAKEKTWGRLLLGI